MRIAATALILAGAAPAHSFATVGRRSSAFSAGGRPASPTALSVSASAPKKKPKAPKATPYLEPSLSGKDGATDAGAQPRADGRVLGHLISGAALMFAGLALLLDSTGPSTRENVGSSDLGIGDAGLRPAVVVERSEGAGSEGAGSKTVDDSAGRLGAFSGFVAPDTSTVTKAESVTKQDGKGVPAAAIKMESETSVVESKKAIKVEYAKPIVTDGTDTVKADAAKSDGAAGGLMPKLFSKTADSDSSAATAPAMEAASDAAVIEPKKSIKVEDTKPIVMEGTNTVKADAIKVDGAAGGLMPKFFPKTADSDSSAAPAPAMKAASDAAVIEPKKSIKVEDTKPIVTDGADTVKADAAAGGLLPKLFSKTADSDTAATVPSMKTTSDAAFIEPKKVIKVEDTKPIVTDGTDFVKADAVKVDGAANGLLPKLSPKTADVAPATAMKAESDAAVIEPKKAITVEDTKPIVTDGRDTVKADTAKPNVAEEGLLSKLFDSKTEDKSPATATKSEVVVAEQKKAIKFEDVKSIVTDGSVTVYQVEESRAGKASEEISKQNVANQFSLKLLGALESDTDKAGGDKMSDVEKVGAAPSFGVFDARTVGGVRTDASVGPKFKNNRMAKLKSDDLKDVTAVKESGAKADAATATSLKIYSDRTGDRLKLGDNSADTESDAVASPSLKIYSDRPADNAIGKAKAAFFKVEVAPAPLPIYSERSAVRVKVGEVKAEDAEKDVPKPSDVGSSLPRYSKQGEEKAVNDKEEVSTAAPLPIYSERFADRVKLGEAKVDDTKNDVATGASLPIYSERTAEMARLGEVQRDDAREDVVKASGTGAKLQVYLERNAGRLKF